LYPYYYYSYCYFCMLFLDSTTAATAAILRVASHAKWTTRNQKDFVPVVHCTYIVCVNVLNCQLLCSCRNLLSPHNVWLGFLASHLPIAAFLPYSDRPDIAKRALIYILLLPFWHEQKKKKEDNFRKA
jgi:hypothetical protein